MAVEIPRSCEACPTTTTRSRQLCDKLQLKEPLRKNIQDLRNLSLVPLNCSFGVVSENVKDKMSLRQVIRKERHKSDCDVTILFAVRRPGCGGCREHAQQLSDFAAQNSGVALVATVKETGTDDKDILTFYEKYFHHAIYKDPSWGIYKAMGGRKVSGLGLIRGIMNSFKRHQNKKIETTMGQSDGWMYGGILIFDKHGQLCYAYEENFGEELDMDLLAAAVAEARAEGGSTSSSSSEFAKADL